MTSSSLPQGDFLSIACQLQFLDDATCQRLETEGQSANLSASDLALRQGLLDAVQADIIETLLHPEEVVPGYEILEWIGRGGMGVVFRARQKSLDRVVAIKTVPVTQMHDPTALARFEQEALAVARLRHPNIVAAFDFGRHAGRLYFVMELIDGIDVERQVELSGPFSEAVAWSLVRQAAAGLSHAASAKIIHRDVKPANLLLVDPPAGFELPHGLKMVKITDFGLAFLARDVDVQTRLTSVNTAIGSPHYLAPEQLGGEGFDHRVDIYALGATAYQLIAGEPPFYGMKLPQLVAQKLSLDSVDVRARFPHISHESGELIRRMTRRSPVDRIGDYPELLQRIDRLLASAPLPSAALAKSAATAPTQIISVDPTPAELVRHPPPPLPTLLRPTPPRLWSRRRFLGVLTGGTAIAAGVGIGLWRLWPSRAPKSSRTLVAVGLGQHLFDGLTLSGWHAHSGAWTVKRNTEGGRVLSGTSGSIIHTLTNQVNKKRTALTHFRLSVVVQLHQAKAAEIEFGRDNSLDDGPRYVAQLSKEGVGIGLRASDASRCVIDSPLLPLDHGHAEQYTLGVERQPQSWWLFLDEKPVGFVPVQPEPTASAFSLCAVEGEAWFSDVIVQSLGASQSEGAP
ncbi:MAG TPA: serine/threonine-protein kinase [Planctomycetaceae bacterium]|nr:serine/threonine-protein kinase [Planctomycetaceae bacterium]